MILRANRASIVLIVHVHAKRVSGCFHFRWQVDLCLPLLLGAVVMSGVPNAI